MELCTKANGEKASFKWANLDIQVESPSQTGGRSRHKTWAGFVGLLVFFGVTALSLFALKLHLNSSQAIFRSKRQSGGWCQVDICLTKECVIAASSILKSIDRTTDPCDDFYRYACGGFIDDNDHRVGVDTLFYGVNQNALRERTDIMLKELLEEPPPQFEHTRPYVEMTTFYSSCLAVADDNRDLKPVLELLKGLEQFQVGKVFQPEQWDITKALLELLRINGAPLFDIINDADVKNSSKFAIVLTPGRRHGLIPALMGPRFSPRQRPGLQEFFRKQWRRSSFGDLGDDLILLELLSELESGFPKSPKSLSSHMRKEMLHRVENNAKAGVVNTVEGRRTRGGASNVVGDSLGNALPDGNDPETDKKIWAETVSVGVLPSQTANPSIQFDPLNTKTTGSQGPSARPSTESPILLTTSQTPPAADTTLPPITASPTKPGIPGSTSDISDKSSTISDIPKDTMNIKTTKSPKESHDDDDDDERSDPTYFDEGVDLDEMEMFPEPPLISRKAVYQVIKTNVVAKRTAAIQQMLMESFLNATEINFPEALADLMTSEELLHEIISHFLPLLDQLEPDENEELEAQQHAKLYNHYTLSKLQEDVPAINWTYLLGELYNTTITDDYNIYVYFPHYLPLLNHLVDTTHPLVLHYGILAVFAYDVLLEATVSLEDVDREDFCLQATKNAFGDVMSHMYLLYIGNSTINNLRSQSKTMLDLLKASVVSSVSESSWMEDADKVEALKKIQGIDAMVGGSDKHWNFSYIEEMTVGLELDQETEFLSHVIHLYKVFRKELYQLYHQTLDPETFIWTFTVQPYVVNAFHMQSTNTIVFPKAFFQHPYYTLRAPEYLNYGSAATAMAHEIFHGIDFTGMLFDEKGHMTRPFSESARQHLNQTVNCYDELLNDTFYELVIVEGARIAMEIESKITLNENLADIGGLRHAFQAYLKWEEQHYPEPRLPALTLSPHQLFFVSAAQPYCAVIPNLAKIFLMEMDEHLPNDIRINAMMMNTPEFAEAFNCPKGSRMVAEETCPVL